MASPTATIWVTIAAAAGTLVVVLAVIAGPSLLRCSSSPDGLFACLRQQVVEAGLLPAPETPPVPIAQPAEPAPLPVEPEAPAPDGSVIVAGSAPPGIEVEVFANGDLVGKAMAEASGDWVVVPDRPLAVGTAEISVGITGSNERSPRTFTVIIPDDEASAPVVTPSDAVTEREPVPVEPPLAVAETEQEPMLEREPTTETPAPPVPAVQPEPSPPSPERDAYPVPAAPPLVVAEAEPPVAPPAPPAITPVPAQPATIYAIEIDGSANYFAGAGPEGATIQLFVQNRFIASATVEGGRWLVEAEGVLTLPVQRVRIDLVRPQGTPSARAEVNFVIDVPPPAPQIEVSATATGSVTSGAAASAEVAVSPQLESELEVDPAIPTLRAIPSADPAMLRFASGKAIIRRGETLWAIAARVYGDGTQYHRIVEANETISSPGRIFPGQVFDLPNLDESAPVN